MKQDYPLFESWFASTDRILDKCDRMPKHTRFTLAGRIANHALDTVELITEVLYSKQKIELLRQVNMNLEKLRLLFRLCFQRRYLSQAQYEYVQQEINAAGRMVGGWIKSCKE